MTTLLGPSRSRAVRCTEGLNIKSGTSLVLAQFPLVVHGHTSDCSEMGVLWRKSPETSVTHDRILPTSSLCYTWSATPPYMSGGNNVSPPPPTSSSSSSAVYIRHSQTQE
ncbi:hypothetical protein CBL_05904 [Carabus blaptoides fortunei]